MMPAGTAHSEGPANRREGQGADRLAVAGKDEHEVPRVLECGDSALLFLLFSCFLCVDSRASQILSTQEVV